MLVGIAIYILSVLMCRKMIIRAHCHENGIFKGINVGLEDVWITLTPFVNTVFIICFLVTGTTERKSNFAKRFFNIK